MSALFIPFWLQHLLVVVGLTCLAGGGNGRNNGVGTDNPPAVQQGRNDTEVRVDSRSEAWPELPLRIENEHYTYVTHYCTVRNQRDSCDFQGRNYTMCFDRTKRGAWWVAYPLHETYLCTGRPKRDPWAYDPAFSSSWQADLSHGSYIGGYDRGHQIPNADRNADLSPGGMCYQTFYASNSTPQANMLNRRSWARLEAKVRGWVCADTLYVVTGAYWCPDSVQTTDKGGNVCAVPDYYFKVVARTVRGDIRQEGDRLGSFAPAQLKSIGFWVANVGEPGELKAWVRSVAEIEASTGFTFFPTLPESVKRQKEASSWGL